MEPIESAEPIHRAVLKDSKPIYQAVWTSSNAHLRHMEWNPVAKCLWDAFSFIVFPIGIARAAIWGVGKIAIKTTLPAVWVFDQGEQKTQIAAFRRFWKENFNVFDKLKSTYRMEEHTVLTPDNAFLRAYCFIHKDAKPGTKTVLLLNPNCVYSAQQPYLWLLEHAASSKTPCNFVAFDYRNVGESKGPIKAVADLILDGESMFQFIEHKLQTPRDKIGAYGWSLGGAVAANAACLRKGVKTPAVLERTFATSSKVVLASLPLIFKIALCWIPPLLRLSGGELDTAKAAKKMQQEGSPLFIIHHPGDPVIKKAAGLYEALKDDLSFTKTMCLGEEDAADGLNHHVIPLSWYETDLNGKKRTAAQFAADFLLERAD